MKEGVALSQLADILPPPAPGGPDWLLLGMIGGICCLVIVAALLWFIKKHYSPRSNSPTREARRRLAALRDEWQSHTLTDREAAYRLATLLRLGLAVPQLSTHIRPSTVKDETLWRGTLEQLQALRYRNESAHSLSPQCFDHAERWLTTAQRQAR
jgi:hypothetical protein